MADNNRLFLTQRVHKSYYISDQIKNIIVNDFN